MPTIPTVPVIDLAAGRVAIVWGLGAVINSEANDYAPWISDDGRLLYFTRAEFSAPRETEGPDGITFRRELIFNGILSAEARKPHAPAFNPELTPYTREETQSGCYVKRAGVAIFTACSLVGGVGGCDLYETVADTARNLTEINSILWESRPALSTDGTTLYFTRAINNDETRVHLDIAVSSRSKGVLWSAPRDIGSAINTPADERSPSVSPDGSLLFFSSNRPGGFGLYDIYMSRRQPDGAWGDPVNIGEPFNSSGNDDDLILSPDGRTYYFASDRAIPGAKGGDDIYALQIVDSSDAW